jgi:hypothetical protein
LLAIFVGRMLVLLDQLSHPFAEVL